VGREKQVKWGEGIRFEVLNIVKEGITTATLSDPEKIARANLAFKYLKNQITVQYWIENRGRKPPFGENSRMILHFFGTD